MYYLRKIKQVYEGQNPWEPLIQCSELHADDRIRKAAVTKLDQRMLAIISRELVTAFGSDLVYAVTHGRIKPPKHVLLPFAVKSLTGNKELVHTLNRLGHSVLYSQFEEIDSAVPAEDGTVKR